MQNLLNQIKILIDKNNEYIDALGLNFNVFNITGVNHYENRHSFILKELLDTHGTHGYKEDFLNSFFEILTSYIDVDNKKDEDKVKNEALRMFISEFNTTNAKVKPEFDTGGYGRIDILIENERKAIIIENKIYAQDYNFCIDLGHSYGCVS